jgi:hypothetical protein
VSSAEPTNYDKLPRDSLLRMIFDLLSGGNSQQRVLSENAVLCLLSSLYAGTSPFEPQVNPDRETISPKLRLPPVDWTPVFSNLTQPGLYTERVRLLLTKFLLEKASFSVRIF